MMKIEFQSSLTSSIEHLKRQQLIKSQTHNSLLKKPYPTGEHLITLTPKRFKVIYGQAASLVTVCNTEEQFFSVVLNMLP